MAQKWGPVREVRDRSHASLSACTSALEEAGGDVERALAILQERGIVAGAERARVAAEGRVHSYVHGEGRIVAVVEVNCETDFAARSPDFLLFCDLLAMQVAAMSPTWVSRDDVPIDVLNRRRAEFTDPISRDVTIRSAAKIDRIVSGKIDKWFSEVCLLEQRPITAEGSSTQTIEMIRAGLSSRLGETIRVRRFARWEVGEGIERAASRDYASEVARLAGG